jgi:hypothetical protein
MSLLLVVVSSHFIVNNILEGMIWFWVPASLVIINDVAAYVCGSIPRHLLLSSMEAILTFLGARRNGFRSSSAHQAQPEEDGRGFRRRFLRHHSLRRRGSSSSFLYPEAY